ncbi:carbohydrate ABC transporter permease [Massiliimalia massiliensis]|uniref:carbohydrate ABC transporter permease n=1 Tax=Massiliimalia massiliensis TaxID=1852384 RepID=UPI00098646FE|nr:sugar ABC transporter permease [Massiliimalia massiliensis]
MKKMMQRDSTWAGIFLLPNLICFLLFVLIPIVSAFVLSFMQWDMLSTPKFIGFDNYIRLFTQDEIFIQVLVNTLIFTACSVPMVIIASLLIAMALNQQILGKKFYRVLIFLPVISSNVVVSVMWKWLLVPDYGFVNYFLSWFGIAGPNWLTDANWSMFSIIFVFVWKNIGYYMLIFLAGLQGIPNSYYEAVEMDGGNAWHKFRNITIPLLSPTTFFVTVMVVIGSFQVFDIVMLMTEGGPGRSTSVMVHYLYQQAFRYFDMGYATAISYILFIIVLILTFLQFRFNKSENWSS